MNYRQTTYSSLAVSLPFWRHGPSASCHLSNQDGRFPYAHRLWLPLFPVPPTCLGRVQVLQTGPPTIVFRHHCALLSQERERRFPSPFVSQPDGSSSIPNGDRPLLRCLLDQGGRIRLLRRVHSSTASARAYRATLVRFYLFSMIERRMEEGDVQALGNSLSIQLSVAV